MIDLTNFLNKNPYLWDILYKYIKEKHKDFNWVNLHQLKSITNNKIGSFSAYNYEKRYWNETKIILELMEKL